MNLAAIDELLREFTRLDMIIVESGGDNLAATFSPELSDLTLYVIDVAAGDKIPSKGGPGITRSDLLVINKTDLAPYVGASLEVMDRDARKMRGARPFVMTNLKTGTGVTDTGASDTMAVRLPYALPPELDSDAIESSEMVSMPWLPKSNMSGATCAKVRKSFAPDACHA